MYRPPENQGRPQNPRDIIGTEFNFGGNKELLVTRDDFSLAQARQELRGKTNAVIGYGIQGPAQALNLRDNGFPVILGLEERYAKPGEDPSGWEKALQTMWTPGKDLFSITEAVQKAQIIQLLLSDAGQKAQWPRITPLLKPDDVLYFSHGFSITYQDQTGVVPPSFVDVVLVAPKGAGSSVRDLFCKGRGINASYAVHQDASGRARERALSIGMAIGSGFLFPTTFRDEVYSDLTGERGVLIGAFDGLQQAAFNILREANYSPEDAVRHTVEISTETISKIVGAKGMDGLIKELPENLLPAFSSAFATARAAANPVFEDLYQKVASGAECHRTLEANGRPDYQHQLNTELDMIASSELGRASTKVRQIRQSGTSLIPSSIQNVLDATMAGALAGIFDAQYYLLRRKGHSASEGANETVEEATQSLYPFVSLNGIYELYKRCSSTAQRGALDWNEPFRKALEPTLRREYAGEVILHQRVLDHILTSEMWPVMATIRALRPENQRLTT